MLNQVQHEYADLDVRDGHKKSSDATANGYLTMAPLSPGDNRN